jgi:hypothetical protein
LPPEQFLRHQAGKDLSFDEQRLERESAMFAKHITKCATAALAAAACVLVMSGVSAAGMNDDQPGTTAAIAYSNPVSLPCHPSLDRGACLKHAERGGGLASDAMTVAQLRTDSDPVSAPCHPSVDRGSCLKH